MDSNHTALAADRLATGTGAPDRFTLLKLACRRNHRTSNEPAFSETMAGSVRAFTRVKVRTLVPGAGFEPALPRLSTVCLLPSWATPADAPFQRRRVWPAGRNLVGAGGIEPLALHPSFIWQSVYSRPRGTALALHSRPMLVH